MWRDVVGYEGIYQVSNTGEVRRISYNDCKKRMKLKEPRLISKRLDKDGYYKVSLYDSERVYIKNKFIHRLVAEAFLNKNINCNQVNHINGFKNDNNVENLEWVNQSQNRRHCLTHLNPKLKNNKLSKPVIQYTIDNKYVNEYPSAKEAQRQTGIQQANISQVCNSKKRIQAGGFKWEYKNQKTAND